MKAEFRAWCTVKIFLSAECSQLVPKCSILHKPFEMQTLATLQVVPLHETSAPADRRTAVHLHGTMVLYKTLPCKRVAECSGSTELKLHGWKFDLLLLHFVISNRGAKYCSSTWWLRWSELVAQSWSIITSSVGSLHSRLRVSLLGHMIVEAVDIYVSFSLTWVMVWEWP